MNRSTKSREASASALLLALVVLALGCVPEEECTGDLCAPGTLCPAGTFAPSANADRCMPWRNCPPGAAVAVSGTLTADRVCRPCADGSYSTMENAPSCVPDNVCPAGTRQVSPPTSTAPTRCEQCPAGVYCPGGTLLGASCVAGTWDHDSNPASACAAWRICPAGSYVSSPGSSTADRQCSACVGGFSASANAPACTSFTLCAPGDMLVSPGDATHDNMCASAR